MRTGREHIASCAWKQALEAFTRAEALDPSTPGVRLHVLWARWKTCGTEAERSLQKPVLLREIEDLLRRQPQHGFTHYVVGVLCLEDGDVVRARRSLARSLALDPENRDAERHLRLARMRSPK